MSKTTKALYVPLSIATSVSGGLLAGAVSNSSGPAGVGIFRPYATDR
jgi:hypothetical protein